MTVVAGSHPRFVVVRMLLATAVAYLALLGFSLEEGASPAATANSEYDASSFRYDVRSDVARSGGAVRVIPLLRSATLDGSLSGSSGADGYIYDPARSFVAPRALPSPSEAADLVRNATPVGSGLKTDAMHSFSTFAVDEIGTSGSVFRIVGGDGVERTLIQVPDVSGRFEWIVDDLGNLTHARFVDGGTINGVPNRL